MLTRNTRHSGTNSRIVLIVNENGHEQLHYTFPKDTYQADQERGQANIYRIEGRFWFDDLTHSSIRIGIRGNDLWAPEHFFIWADTWQQPEGRPTNLPAIRDIVPIAIEVDIKERGEPIKLSTDVNEGRISCPIYLASTGASDMPIRQLLMLLTTKNEPEWAGSNSQLSLKIVNEGNFIVDFNTIDTPQSDLEEGQANWYFVPVSSIFTKSEFMNGTAYLDILGSDAWKPENFFLFGLNIVDSSPNTIVPLVHISSWSSIFPFTPCLSTDPSEGDAGVILPKVPD
jgi:hypothetical protein